MEMVCRKLRTLPTGECLGNFGYSLNVMKTQVLMIDMMYIGLRTLLKGDYLGNFG